MAKEKKTLEKFEAVALPEEKAQQIIGGYKQPNVPRTEPAPGFIGWGEVEIRSVGLFQVAGAPTVKGISRIR
jgi:hypothetical protein